MGLRFAGVPDPCETSPVLLLLASVNVCFGTKYCIISCFEPKLSPHVMHLMYLESACTCSFRKCLARFFFSVNDLRQCLHTKAAGSSSSSFSDSYKVKPRQVRVQCLVTKLINALPYSLTNGYAFRWIC